MRLPSSISGLWPAYFVVVAVLSASLVGCARLSSPDEFTHLPQFEKACLSMFIQHDNAIKARKVNDAQYARIVGYPFLRLNRLLQSLSTKLDSNAKRLLWLERLAALDHNARSLENRNLPDADRKNLADLNNCRAELIDHLAESPQSFENLLNNATVDDSYSILRRLAGLYPISKWPVFNGVVKLQAREKPLPELRPGKTTRLYSTRVVSLPKPFSKILSPARDELEFPQFESGQVKHLLDAYAPVWAIETSSESDMPGTLNWSHDEVTVETNSPSGYRHYSYALFEDKPVLQLMYTIWFPAVPSTGGIDIYAGKIDGLTFRVTLDHDFTPLVVDIMHNCGCYYMAFPSPRLSAKSVVEKFEEPLWIPFTLAAPDASEQYAIQLRAGNHFVMGISLTSRIEEASQEAMRKSLPPRREMIALPYDTLRSIPTNSSTNRSVFSSRGLIENSHRMERFVLWPMGVLSAGAMRQSGHHAIAFVGRRHFDDPEMINDYFVRR